MIQVFEEFLPTPMKINPLMKRIGIVSLNSVTDGTLGLIKRTYVEFMVHNFYDFDRIYNKFFKTWC